MANKPPTQPSSNAASRPKGSTLTGATSYSVLRLLDIPLQHAWLSTYGPGLLQYLGATALQSTTSTLASFPAASSSLLSSTTGLFGLTPYHSLVFLLSIGSAAKHTWWSWSILNYVFPIPLASAVAGYNTGLNLINGLLSLWARSSNDPSGTSNPISATAQTWASVLDPRASSVPLGLALYLLGMSIEVVAETQRKSFKSAPANRDAPFAGGLFGVVRNVNYTGYLLWRVGFAVVCAGWPMGLVVLVQQGCDFAFRAVPEMDAYCEQRYGARWDEVRRAVPSRLIPGVY